jgi:hypothetical protein
MTMKLLWTMVKVVAAVVLLIPLSLLMLGLFGTVLGIAIALLRLALIGLVAYGAFRLVARLIRGPAKPAERKDAPRVASPDPYYEAAMRELDRDLADIRTPR